MEEPWFCSENCHSKQHGDFLSKIVLSKNLTDQEVAAFLTWKCSNFAGLTNSTGKSLAQIAAGTGRLKLLRFLLSKCNNLNDCDKKTGDSALHLSLYYGMIQTAVRLIQLGGDFLLNSKYLSPLDLVLRDVYQNIDISKEYMNDVYVWGSNTNYNLGCGHNKERPLPELLDYFYKNKISIVKARIEKFHSVYLDNRGNAWSCGLGIRAGLGSDAPILLPKKVLADMAPVIAISTSEQHTIYLLENGIAFSCGFNTYSVLGHLLQSQTLATPKPIRGLPPLKGVCAAPFHSVFYSDTLLFTCGKNVGQLGHPDEKGEAGSIPVPKAVTAIKMTHSKYECIAACAGATVVLNNLGSVYLLSNFRCTRITPRDWFLRGKMVGAVGGPTDPDCELRVVLITEDNNLFIYRTSNPQLVQCSFSLTRELSIFDIALTSTGCIVTTTLGEGFYGKFLSENTSEEEVIELERIPHIYRGRSVACDSLGRNMAIVQISPLFEEVSSHFSVPSFHNELFLNLSALLENATVEDSIHDLEFKVQGHMIPAHSYVVLYGNTEFSMSKLAEEKRFAQKDIVDLNDLPIGAFRCVLSWLYSMRCPFCYASVLSNDCFGHMIELERKEKSDLQLVAKTLGVTNFIKALKGEELPSPYFDRAKGSHDAVLEADDGLRLFVHKCILVARSEYFSAMLTHGWSEAGKTELKVPVSGRVMLTLVDFMYNASSSTLDACDDVEFIIQVMVDADKILLDDVITVATHRLQTLMNLRNVADILHFSIRYHNALLEEEARIFILRNLPAALETRILEGFSDEYLEELSRCYRDSMALSSRRLENTLDPLEVAIVQSLAMSHPINIDLELDVAKEDSQAKRRKRGKKTTERTHKQSEGNNEQVPILPLKETVPVLSKLNENERVLEIIETPRTEKCLKPVSPHINISPTSENMTVLIRRTQNIALADFPDLNSKKLHKTTPKISAEPSKKFVKLSQRERRRLASVTSSDGDTPSSVTENMTSPRSPWATLPSPPSNSAQSIPDSPVAIKTIIYEEKSEKERIARLKNKPLALTQIEDRALKELEVFYNVANITDERITVERLNSITVAAPPVWPINRKNISL